jgi:hypothetical protein
MSPAREAVYVPAGQPDPLSENLRAGNVRANTDRRRRIREVAVTATREVMVNTRGLAVLEPAPLHNVNWYPSAGVAVRLIVEPAA